MFFSFFLRFIFAFFMLYFRVVRMGGHAIDHGQALNTGRWVKDCAYMVHALTRCATGAPQTCVLLNAVPLPLSHLQASD